MKKTLYLKVVVCLIGILYLSACSTSKTAEEKAQRQEQQRITAQTARDAFTSQDFVFEANRIIFRSGRPASTFPFTNFVMMQGEDVIIQTSLSVSNPGPNAIGGITIQGRADNIQQSTARNGNLLIDFQVMAAQGLYRVNAELFNNSDQGRVTVSATFSADQFRFEGRILPAADADVYRGRFSVRSPRF